MLLLVIALTVSDVHTRLFVPPALQDGRSTASVSTSRIEEVAAEYRRISPPQNEGSFRVSRAAPLEAFDGAAVFDRARVARLYGGRRVSLARGPVIRDGVVIEMVTLVSPYPDADLSRLVDGTLVLVLRLPPFARLRYGGAGHAVARRLTARQASGSEGRVLIGQPRGGITVGETGIVFHMAERKPSIEKALDVCEALSTAQRGQSVGELARTLRMPAATVHRLLAALKRRGYVRQDDDTARYSLTLKMLDLSFRLLDRSELRLHAYPVLREYVLRTGNRSFLAVPSAGDVTYVWSAGPDEAAMYTAYGKEMPGHCSVYFDPQAKRRLSCLRLSQPRDAQSPELVARRLGQVAAAPGLQCTCAPVRDYSGRDVARVGVFLHAADDEGFARTQPTAAWELARLISLRLGHLPAATLAVGA